MQIAGLGGAVAAVSWPARLAWGATGAPGRKLRLAFFTDVHARAEWQTPDAMMKAAEAINLAKPDVVVAGGDLITDGFQNPSAVTAPRWKVYLNMHGAIDADVFPVIGNHDLVAAAPEDGSEPAEDARKPFKDHFGLESTYRSADLAGYHLIMIDPIQIQLRGSASRHYYHGHISEAQIEWLREDLAGVEAARPIILATHIPLVTAFYQTKLGTSEPAPRNRVVVNNREVLELFEGRNLALVLQGHLHVEEMIKCRGTTFITGGAVCGKWWRGPYHGTEQGFGLLTLRDDHIEWKYVDYGWEARRPDGK